MLASFHFIKELNSFFHFRSLNIRFQDVLQLSLLHTLYNLPVSGSVLHNLDSGTERDIYMDPLSVDTVRLMIEAFGTNDPPMDVLRLTELVEFLCFKNAQGKEPISEQFANQRLLELSEADVAIVDASIDAQRKHDAKSTADSTSPKTRST